MDTSRFIEFADPDNVGPLDRDSKSLEGQFRVSGGLGVVLKLDAVVDSPKSARKAKLVQLLQEESDD